MNLFHSAPVHHGQCGVISQVGKGVKTVCTIRSGMLTNCPVADSWACLSVCHVIDYLCTAGGWSSFQIHQSNEPTLHFKGSRPEWCISSMIIYIVKIYHSGRKPSICFLFRREEKGDGGGGECREREKERELEGERELCKRRQETEGWTDLAAVIAKE